MLFIKVNCIHCENEAEIVAKKSGLDFVRSLSIKMTQKNEFQSVLKSLEIKVMKWQEHQKSKVKSALAEVRAKVSSKITEKQINDIVSRFFG